MAVSKNLWVERMDAKEAADTVIRNHYLHRRPGISHAFALRDNFMGDPLGVVTFGTPGSRHLQLGACRSHPNLVIELNRLWVCDSQARNTESWFVSRALKMMPPRIVVSYADTAVGHTGTIYRALSWNYAGLSKVAYDWVKPDTQILANTRGMPWLKEGRIKVYRSRKYRFWTVTGFKKEKKRIRKLVTWPCLDYEVL